MEENLENVQPKFSKLKKCIKRFFIVLGCVIGFAIIRFLSLLLFARLRDFELLERWVIIIIPTIISIVLISFIVLLIKLIKSKGNKKAIKWSFVADCIIIFLMILCGLTKAGIIPNLLGIEANRVDCQGRYFSKGDKLEINGKKCREGTYKINYVINHDGSRKPIIYLYPTVETEVHLELGTPEKLSHTYPKYNPEKGRNVIAQPDGDLEDIDTGRKLYALYWEGKNSIEANFDEGFVVKGEDIIPFLEEKLAILGLNEREAEEFIIYWLPQMENNEYNLIRFETKAQQDENMPLNITPKPDTVIRVMMDWKAIDEPIDIPEQKLETPERIGFTVVEWGGSPRS